MANYNNLKATINANIKANGNEEITGPILNTVLNQAVTTLGDGWSYKGIATPSMSPGTPDSNVFYIATTAGTYTNFGSLVVAEGEVAILKYNGSWAKEVTGAATAAQVTQLGQEVNTNKTNITNLQQEIDSIQPIVIEGNVTNAPDEEDITTDSNDLLKFADRPTAVNQMGYVVLRKNKTFAEQVTQENTIYEIRYEFDLGGESVTIPEGCVLKFEGGKLSNGNIVFNNTIIDVYPRNVFGADVNVSGLLGNAVTFPEWFGAAGDGETNDASAIQKAIDVSNNVCGVNGKTYAVSASPNVHCLTIKRDNQSLSINLLNTDIYDTFDYRGRAIIFCNSINGFRFHGEIHSVNDNVPVSASSGQTLEMSRGGILCWGNCSDFDVEMKCSNLYAGISSGAFINKDYLSRNGTTGVSNGRFNVIAKRVAYPIAFNYGNNNRIDVKGEEMHRCIYLCGSYNKVNAVGRDYYATAAPAHVLLLSNFIIDDNENVVLKTSNFNEITYKELQGESHFTYEPRIFMFQPIVEGNNNPPVYEHVDYEFLGNVLNVYCVNNSNREATNYVFPAPAFPTDYDKAIKLELSINLYGDISNYTFRGIDLREQGFTYNLVVNNYTRQKLDCRIEDSSPDSLYVLNGAQETWVKALSGVVRISCEDQNKVTMAAASEVGGSVFVEGNPYIVVNSDYNHKHIRLNNYDYYPTASFRRATPAANQVGRSFFETQTRKPNYWDGSKWVESDGFTAGTRRNGTTAQRPANANVSVGFTYFDTDLGKMIVFNGSAWVNMDGTAL